MRQFENTIFMGAGQSTESECYKLICRLQEGLKILGGLQQPDHPDSINEEIKCKQWRRMAGIELEDIKKDICCALGKK